MQVTPGYQLPDSTTPWTRDNVNLMAIPSVALDNGEVEDVHITGPITGSKISDIPLASLSSAVQNKFGFKNWTPNASFDNWGATTSFTVNGEICDKWFVNFDTLSFTAERAGVALGDVAALGDSKYYLELITTTASGAVAPIIYFKIPNVRIFSGQSLTISAKLKQFSGTVGNIKFFITQKFGTGGSPSADVTTRSDNVTADGNWSLKSGTITVPSVASKTAGTAADDELWIGLEVQAASATFNLGVDNFQVELGSTATSFEIVEIKEWQGQPIDNSICNAVLTLSSGSPLMTSSSGGSNVYITPYNGNKIALWNGAYWTLAGLLEKTISISGFAANGVWDVFAYNNSGIAEFETLVWTNQTTRATNITYQDGVLCKSGDKTRRYIGSFATTSSVGTTDLLRGAVSSSDFARCLIYSHYGPDYSVHTRHDTGPWSYSTNSWRQVNALANNKIVVLNGVNGNRIEAVGRCRAYGDGISYRLGISTSASSIDNISSSLVSAVQGNDSNRTDGHQLNAIYSAQVNIGVITLHLLEYGSAGTIGGEYDTVYVGLQGGIKKS